MCKNELISVIVPIYNAEKYLRQTIDSIINQSYQNIEVLLIDDGSTDDSGIICDEYLYDERVQVFHRKNVGVAASRQFGLDVCKGTYFITLDSDDYIDLDFVENLHYTVKENHADISVCGVSCFTDITDDKFVAYVPPKSYKKLCITKELLVSDFNNISTDMLLSDAWNKMYKTQFVKDTNVKFELPNSNIGSELLFNQRILLHCPTFAVCKEVLLYHRIRSGSLMQSFKAHVQEGFEWITEQLLAECDLLGISITKQISNLYYWLIGCIVYDIFNHKKGVCEKHKAFKIMIAKNKLFLKKHKNNLVKHKFLKLFKIGDSSVKLPAFVLANALLLDIVSVLYTALQKLKYSFRKIL